MLIAPPALTIATRLKEAGESAGLPDLPGLATAVDVHESLSAVAFGALLNATRAGLAAPGAPGTSTSPAQMFEVSVTDAHEHRLSALRDQDRADLRSSADDRRLAVTRIDARRALDAGDASGRSTTRSSATMANQIAETTPELIPAGAHEFGGARGLDSNVAGELSAGAGRARHSRLAAARGPGNAAHSLGRQPPPPATDTRLAPGVVPQAVASGVGPSATAATTHSGSVSQQVGRVLGAATSGEAESARAVVSSPAHNGPRQSGGSSTQTPQSAKGRQADSSRWTPQTDETRSSRQSPFDRLVRSIRLKAGSMNSTARLHLEPPELGRIRIDVRMTASRGDSPEQIQIDVRTETAEARELLYERSAHLKEALEQHGIRVDRFSVTHDTPAHQHGDEGGGNDSGADVDRGNRQFAAADGQKNAGAPAPHQTTDSDDSGASETAPMEPDQTTGAEARLDIRI